MTKGKKWTLRLLGVAALALLICLCLMGSTMARYTSKGEGSGTLTVALWDLETAEIKLGEDEEMESVSPSADDYTEYATDNEDSPARHNESDWIAAFTMENNSDVDALVTLSTDGTVKLGWSTDNFEWGKGWTKLTAGDGGADGDDIYADGSVRSGRAQTNAYGSNLMLGFGEGSDGEEAFEEVVNSYGIFTIELGYDEDNSGSVTAFPEDGITIPAKTDEGATSETIYARVVWTSVYEEYPDPETGTLTSRGDLPTPANYVEDVDPGAWTSWSEYSDAIDTILGMYVETLSFGVSWTAVQASVLPPNA